MAGFGIWYALSHKRWLAGAAIAGVAALWAAIAIAVVIPHFNAAPESSFYGRYSEVGSTPGGIVHTALTDPWKIVTTAVTGRDLHYLARARRCRSRLLVLLAPLVL